MTLAMALLLRGYGIKIDDSIVRYNSVASEL